MPSFQRHLLPLWESEPSPNSTENTEQSTESMILVSVAPALESALRAVVRDVDGVDSDLREKILACLPSVPTVGDQEEATAAATPEAASPSAGRNGEATSRVNITPATLARALPHIRRLIAPGGGEGNGETASAGGMLGLLRGGGLVFPESRASATTMKQGEEKRMYEERRERLRLLMEQKEYQRMTANVQRAPRETVRDIQASFTFQAGMGANMVVATLTTFIIAYWASKFVVGNKTSHRLVIGLVGAMFIMLVELLVFVTRSIKADEVLETARQLAEESHTAVGVHRLAPRVGEPGEPIRGRGVLEQGQPRRSRGGRGGEYELVATGGGDESNEVGGAENVGIRRVVQG